MMATHENEGLLRLGYWLAPSTVNGRFMLSACDLRQNRRLLNETEVRALRRKLHPLDQAVVQQLIQGPFYGQLGDAHLARLLPLLVRRDTQTPEGPLSLYKKPLIMRARIPESTPNQLQLYLMHPDLGEFGLQQGTLLCGNQAYLLQGSVAHPIRTPQPQLLLSWVRLPIQLIPNAHTDLAEREQFIQKLQQMGVPEEDLASISIQTPVDVEFTVVGMGCRVKDDEPVVEVCLQANYQDFQITLASNADNSNQGLIEQTDGRLLFRDTGAEGRALGHLEKLGFVAEGDRFVARGDQALAFLEQQNQATLPTNWRLSGDFSGILIRQHLEMHTDISFLRDQGVLDVRVHAQASNETAHDETTDAATMHHLNIDIQALLSWLRTPRHYIKLEDGSFVAPPPAVREGLTMLRDMGIQSDRALISPLCVGLLRAMKKYVAVQAVDEVTNRWLAELSTGQGPLSVELPKGLTSTLRDYQRRGLDWLMMLHRHALTGILADDMGLGKTLQTLAFLLAIKEQEGSIPSLVVAPTSVINVWVDEARRHTPSLSVVLWYGPPASRTQLPTQEVDLVVTSYGIVRRDIEKLAQIPFRYVILDEAQHAKNAQTHSAFAIRKLNSTRRLALSGTPLENRPEELWSIFDFLAPGFLGTLSYFRKHYAKPILQGEKAPLELLSNRIAPLILRRLKSEVAKDLPEKMESIIRCEMGPAQRALYEHIAQELRSALGSKIKRYGFEKVRMDVFAALTRLRQICCDPSLLPTPPGFKTPPSAKLVLFEELMRQALDSNSCVVVFSQFVQMQRRLIQIIKNLGVDPLWLHGGSTHRETIVARFQDPNGPRVIVVSLRAGGIGVTLTRANMVMHCDPWWNPAVERQATDRAHRLGQLNPVTVYHLICANSIEEKVMEKAVYKEGLAAMLLRSEGGARAKKILEEDVLALLA